MDGPKYQPPYQLTTQPLVNRTDAKLLERTQRYDFQRARNIIRVLNQLYFIDAATYVFADENGEPNELAKEVCQCISEDDYERLKEIKDIYYPKAMIEIRKQRYSQYHKE